MNDGNMSDSATCESNDCPNTVDRLCTCWRCLEDGARQTEYDCYVEHFDLCEEHRCYRNICSGFHPRRRIESSDWAVPLNENWIRNYTTPAALTEIEPRDPSEAARKRSDQDNQRKDVAWMYGQLTGKTQNFVFRLLCEMTKTFITDQDLRHGEHSERALANADVLATKTEVEPRRLRETEPRVAERDRKIR